MIQVKFKNLEKSDLITHAVTDRVEALEDKFPALKRSRIQVTLEMENSPTQAGLDRYNVQLYISGGRFHGHIIKKSDANLYKALADLIDHMLEKLNRAGDKARVKNLTKTRKFLRKAEIEISNTAEDESHEKENSDKFSA